MSDIDVFRGRSRQGAGTTVRSGQSRLNGWYAGLLGAVVILAPLALGSNRPFFWTVWACVLGLMLAIYGIFVQMRGLRLRAGPADMVPEMVAYICFCAFLVIQILPLGGFGLVPELFTQSGVALHLSTISTTPGNTLLMLLRWGTYGAMFFLGVQVSLNSQRRMRMLWLISAMVTIHAVFGLLFYYQWGNTILGIQKWAYLDSLTGSFVNRNSFATFLAIGLVVNVSLAVATVADEHVLPGTRQSRVALLLVSVLCILAALFATNSRMGLLAGLVGAALVIALGTVKSAALGNLAKAALAVLIVIGFFAAGYMFGDSLWARFLDVGSAAGVRFELYHQVLEMIAQRPWLGFGGGSFEQTYQLFHRPPVSIEYVWDRTHNSYLALWVELGVVVGTLPLAIIALCFTRASVSFFAKPAIDAASLAGIGVIAVAAVHSTVDFSLEIQATTLLFVLLLAMVTAANIQRVKSLQRDR